MCELLCTFFVDFPVENNQASKKNNSSHINTTLISPSQTRYNHPTCNTTSTHVTAAANQHDIAEDLNKQRLGDVRTRGQHRRPVCLPLWQVRYQISVGRKHQRPRCSPSGFKSHMPDVMFGTCASWPHDYGGHSASKFSSSHTPCPIKEVQPFGLTPELQHTCSV